MFTFLLILEALVALALCTVILMQRSEGGGLGVGGSSAGLMTARGAADFLTRATAVLGGLFVILCIALAAYSGTRTNTQSIDASVANQAAPISQQTPAGTALPGQPTGTTTAPATPAAPGSRAPAGTLPAPTPVSNGAVPLAQ
ncbi:MULTISPECIES: preprotein translocase subunit SecG [Sphingomonas]|uniref:preprotein translocase subunit SecG n=1 Tax=Sphingomonas TaxID=13687 RepID=UPI000DEF0857|nr:MULTISPECIES: preprotein translocase subunit SecG [Sphingomonas]